MNIPSNLKYTKDHEWILIDGDTATVGITDFAQGELGDIVYVEVETLDETMDADEVFGSVEAVKTVSDLFLPLSGEIIAFNDTLESDPEKVNNDPYGEGWMIKIKISNPEEIENLLDETGYKELVGA
ncbi:glycine cleavage system protein GcvH [Flavobacteriaceae bacterium]|jgi:glycine cleavage system H protein|nr:glycine cleavage system protein GcvH [Bacteroidota bacterium]MDA8971551.1 glycine cleavage system protein GcvH [Flavobacteriaceae bacterium]MDG1501694.1 glycine cleavage system protein GcvH [Ulvibacter sp.]MBT7306094.1 glycine cleavage system protein GcvH [Bacteroidota bacterium]MDA9215610.1 glycine cleavage system protein GcvH [Flavobacteriaceae bacterium]|tara:strand:- start:133 stop:513 length:381 start_codon:yes stop_codon:yes gene_type:complete